jgi:hypothetical protein
MRPEYGCPMAVPMDAVLAWVVGAAAPGGALADAGRLGERTGPLWVP